MAIGKSVRLFLVDGTPGGLTTAEIMNWTGHVISASRTDLPRLINRLEAKRTGVYILLGEDSEHGEPAAYIGEGDDISRRLRSHNQPESSGGKDFWTRAIILTSKDANLTKAHVRYLESRMISIATAARRSRIQNGTAPDGIQLPESDVSDMEYFIEQAKIVLPVLGVNILRAKAIRVTNSTDSPFPVPAQTAGPGTSGTTDIPEFRLSVPRHRIDATAQEIDGEFTVLEGSLAKSEWSKNLPGHSYGPLHESLLQDGTLSVADGDTLARFTKDHVFNSPSAAASVVAGRPTNGRKEWIESKSNLSYGAWQDKRVDEAAQDANERTGETPAPNGPEDGA